MSLQHRFAREDVQKSTEDAFERFWRAYPRRIAKGAARASFARAIGKTNLETMLAAIETYIARKPAYQDFKHPATWLNQECWDDEWDVPSSPSTGNSMMDALYRTGRAH